MSKRPPSRIVIADDHAIFRGALKALMESRGDFRVVGEAADGAEAVRLTRQLQPDVLLLDVAMPRIHGLRALREITASASACPVVVLSACLERPQLMEALRLGARGVVLKQSATSVLFQCLHAVLAGEYWVDGTRMEDLLQFFRTIPEPERRPAPAFGLTPRELEVVSVVVRGSTNRHVAERLALSQETVKHHLYNIFGKLGVANRTELALFAYTQGLVENPPGTTTPQ